MSIKNTKTDLHKYCQDMKGISDRIEIKNIGQQLILFCEDQDSGSSQTVILGDTKDNESNINGSNISFEKNTDNRITLRCVTVSFFHY